MAKKSKTAKKTLPVVDGIQTTSPLVVVIYQSAHYGIDGRKTWRDFQVIRENEDEAARFVSEYSRHEDNRNFELHYLAAGKKVKAEFNLVKEAL